MLTNNLHSNIAIIILTGQENQKSGKMRTKCMQSVPTASRKPKEILMPTQWPHDKRKQADMMIYTSDTAWERCCSKNTLTFNIMLGAFILQLIKVDSQYVQYKTALLGRPCERTLPKCNHELLWLWCDVTRRNFLMLLPWPFKSRVIVSFQNVFRKNLHS